MDTTFLDVDQKDFDEALLEQLNEALADFEKNASLLEDHRVVCQGTLLETGIKAKKPSKEISVQFVGYVQQSRQRVRWVSRRPTTRFAGVIGDTEGKVEVDILKGFGATRCWFDGIEQLPSRKTHEREKQLEEMTRAIAYFHPITVSTIGLSGLSVPWARGGKVVIDKIRKSHLSEIARDGKKIVAVWHVPNAPGYVRNEIHFDTDQGGMPVYAKKKQVLFDFGVQFTLGTIEVAWELSDLGVFIPTELRMLQYQGGEKNPVSIQEGVLECKFDLGLSDEVFEPVFALVTADSDRPTWTEELQEVFGDTLRVDGVTAVEARKSAILMESPQLK